MLRSISFVAGMAVAGALLAGTPAYADPVTDATRAVETATGQDVPDIKVDGGPVVVGPGGGVGRGVGGRSAVVGYIAIQWLRSQGQPGPTYTLAGALGDSTLWTCSSTDDGSSYSVTCLPASTAVTLDWHCDVLHADITTNSPEAAARTRLDCDSDGVPEAQTALTTGDTGHDFQWAADTRLVTAFTCTVDAVTGPAVPDYISGCGDPGLVGVTVS